MIQEVPKKTYDGTHIPKNIKDVNTFYFSRKTSMNKKLPQCNVFCYKDHACVRMYDVIAHMVAHGLEFESLDLNINQSCINSCDTPLSVSDTPNARAIISDVSAKHNDDEEILILPVTLWSDDFEVTFIKTTK